MLFLQKSHQSTVKSFSLFYIGKMRSGMEHHQPGAWYSFVHGFGGGHRCSRIVLTDHDKGGSFYFREILQVIENSNSFATADIAQDRSGQEMLADQLHPTVVLAEIG